MEKKTFLKIAIAIILFIIFIFFVFIIKGYGADEEKLDSKVEEEISYIEDKIISMMNSINQITFSNYELTKKQMEVSSSENTSQNSQSSNSEEKSNSSSSGSSDSSNNKESDNSKSNVVYELKNSGVLTKTDTQIDWEYLKSNIEIMNSKWATSIVDLHQLNVNNDDILKFSDMLNQTTISIKQEDKVSSIVNLANLYAYMPNYLKQFSKKQQKIDISSIKSNILNSYALVEQDRWDEMKTQVGNAISTLSTFMNSVDSNTNSQNKISKIYVLLNELNNIINLKDKDLYYIKYRNVMEELSNF